MDEAQVMTNTEIDFPLGGKTFKVKKASLKLVMDFQRKVAEITKEKDAAGDLRMASYAIYLAVHAVDSTITEDYVLENVPGDIDVMDVFIKLGFMSQQKVEMMAKIRNSLALKNQQSGGDSLE